MFTHTLFRRNITNVIGVFIASVAGAMWIDSVAIAQSSQGQEPDPIRVPPVNIVVYGEPQDAQGLPITVTGVSESVLNKAGIGTISDLESLVPNTFFSRFNTRKLINPRFRGIPSSPSNPGIITYIDGVPQLNASSSSIQLLDIDQVEFVRGPQLGLYGRSSLGGVVSMTTRRPSDSDWSGSVIAPLGMARSRHSAWGGTLSASGALTDSLSLAFAFGHDQRHGYTINDSTGRDVDYRHAQYGKAQIFWNPGSEWEGRLIVSGERDRDGDSPLADLAVLRTNPFHVQRGFAGFTHRDVMSSTLQARRKGLFDFETITGAVRWTGRDATQLDLSALPRFTRDNKETDLQLTQEFRLSSGASSFRLVDGVNLKFQTGVFLYAQEYDQDQATIYAPYLLSASVGRPATQHYPLSEMNDRGIGVYGQTTGTIGENLSVTFGMRLDKENKRADVTTSYDPATIAPSRTRSGRQTFSHKSPQFSATYKIQDGRMIYGSFGRGYKAGGFNGSAPTVNSETYGQEDAWHMETGIKTVMADGKFSANGSFFYIEWGSMQLEIPNPSTWAQYYITNVGRARSEGVEFDLNARPYQNVDIFGSVGLIRARFLDGASADGGNIAGKIIPHTPGITMSAGSQLSQDVFSEMTLYGRGEIWLNGGFEYNAANSQRQAPYSLINYRIGLKRGGTFAEFWVKNALDKRYIPVAFAYETTFAPSGFVGEMGAPRTYGIRLGYEF